MSHITLSDFTFDSLFMPEKLKLLDQHFLDYLKTQDALLYQRLLAYRDSVVVDNGDDSSELLIDVAKILDAFLARFFDIEVPCSVSQNVILADDPVFEYKKEFVARDAKRHLKEEINATFAELTKALLSQCQIDNDDVEHGIALYSLQAKKNQEQDQAAYLLARNWAILALRTEEGRAFVKGWVSFKQAKKTDFDALVDVSACSHDGVAALEAPDDTQVNRYGFNLTDSGMSQRNILDEIHYCVYCHKNQGDFCSKGFPIKKKQPELGLKENPLGELLTGCPLEEKISEMHVLKRHGFVIAPLAMIMIDNPMCPATGHRICNDCMKACIYQKQEPVDIPQIETRVLKDVLALPYGVEIYDLLTRWNPLLQKQPFMQPFNGKNILVMGMGPAGFTLAHYLLHAGFGVLGADGLKIEPIDSRFVDQPIASYDSLCENLDDRVTLGFGGVAEYGITVRWDKNFLKLIYVSLMRKQHFTLKGGVRFGGTLTVERAFDLGFDHVAIAVGAGLPKELPIKNSLAPGMRQANDFLMALQLTGAQKESSLANLQIRLPAVVIGGGLTGVDAATELQAYYIRQIEKVAHRYRALCKVQGEALVRSNFSERDLNILDEFLNHYQLLEDERERAKQELRPVNYLSLVRRFGGVSIVYRKRMQDSPAYRKNHEELNKALQEGLFYLEHMQPEAVVLDEYGDAKALNCKHSVNGDEHTIAAKTILVATGAKPNVAYSFEHRHTFVRSGLEYQRYQNVAHQLEAVNEPRNVKSKDVAMFTSYNQNEKRVTFLGDTHPTFHGSVVKAIASAKRCYYAINALFKGEKCAATENHCDESAQMFDSVIVENKRINEHACELIIESPLAREQYAPGRFYRLQNFETDSQVINNTKLFAEGVALLAAPVANSESQLSFLVFDHGASSKVLQRLNAGNKVALMGPSGVRTKIPETEETLLVIGGAMALAHLRGLAPEMRQAGNRVCYLGLFNQHDEIILKDEIDELCDEVYWQVGKTDSLKAALSHIDLAKVSRIMVIGAPTLLRQVKQERKVWLDQAVACEALWYASVYGTMQCMLKGVCAQCLQWQIDPETGKRTKAVYACSWQDQPFEKVDIHNIDERLSQNTMQEQLTNQWLDAILTNEN